MKTTINNGYKKHNKLWYRLINYSEDQVWEISDKCDEMGFKMVFLRKNYTLVEAIEIFKNEQERWIEPNILVQNTNLLEDNWMTQE